MYAELLSQLRERLATLTESAEGETSEELKNSIAEVVAQLDAAIEKIHQDLAK
jgi:hypothetical protein